MGRLVSISIMLFAVAACGKVDEAPDGNPSPPPAEKAPWIVAAAHPLAVDAGGVVNQLRNGRHFEHGAYRTAMDGG